MASMDDGYPDDQDEINVLRMMNADEPFPIERRFRCAFWETPAANVEEMARRFGIDRGQALDMLMPHGRTTQ